MQFQRYQFFSVTFTAILHLSQLPNRLGWKMWTWRRIAYFANEEIAYLFLIFRIFQLPHYCSSLLDLSLLHSRKRHRSTEDLTDSRREAQTSKIYIAATMWHENRVEMKQILTSLFRFESTIYVPFQGLVVKHDWPNHYSNKYL